MVTVPDERDESIPAAPARQGILQALPSALGLVLTVGTLVAITWHAGQSLTNTDTYFHLRFGHEFLAGLVAARPGQRDDLRHRRLGADPVAAADRDGPDRGLVRAAPAWRGCRACSTSSLAVTAVGRRRRRAEPLVAAADRDPGALRLQPGLSMRPQVISYLLVAVARRPGCAPRDDGRARWWLVPLTWVWAMCHGMWPVGIVIGLVAVVGLALDRGLRAATWPKLAAVPVASAVAVSLSRRSAPGLYPAVLLVGSRGAVLRRVGVARLHAAGQRRPAAAVRPDVGPDAARRRGVLVDRDPAGRAGRGLRGLLDQRPPGGRVHAGAAARPARCRSLTQAEPPHRRETTRRGGRRRRRLVGWPCRPRTSTTPPGARRGSTARLDACPPGTKCSTTGRGGGYFMWRYPQLDLMMHGYGDIFTADELARNSASMRPARAGWLESTEHARPTGSGSPMRSWISGWSLHRSADLVLLAAHPAGRLSRRTARSGWTTRPAAAGARVEDLGRACPPPSRLGDLAGPGAVRSPVSGRTRRPSGRASRPRPPSRPPRRPREPGRAAPRRPGPVGAS